MRYNRGERIFEVEILNPKGVERGVTALEINGSPSQDGKIPYEHPSYGKIVTVRVRLG